MKNKMNNELLIAIDKYLDKGFGTMNKNDFEVFIFNVLLETKYKSKGDYEISLSLRIPISKVKRLRYEASLRYQQNLNFNTLFVESIRNARFMNSEVVFYIDNIALRQYLNNKLKECGHYFDTSFNTEIIKINKGDLKDLFESIFLTKDEIKEIEKAIRKNTNSNVDVSKLLVDSIGEIVNHIAGESIGKLTEYGLDNIVHIIQNKIQN